MSVRDALRRRRAAVAAGRAVGPAVRRARARARDRPIARRFVQLLAVSVLGDAGLPPAGPVQRRLPAQLRHGAGADAVHATACAASSATSRRPTSSVAIAGEPSARCGCRVVATTRGAARSAPSAPAIVAWLVSMPLIAYHFEQLNPWAVARRASLLARRSFLALIGGFLKIVLTLLLPCSRASVGDARGGAGRVDAARWSTGSRCCRAATCRCRRHSMLFVVIYYALLFLPLLPLVAAAAAADVQPRAGDGGADARHDPAHRRRGRAARTGRCASRCWRSAPGSAA